MSPLPSGQDSENGIIQDDEPGSKLNIASLQQRKDVVALSTMFRMHRQHTAHLQPPRQPQVHRTTKRVDRTPSALAEPTVERGIAKGSLSQDIPRLLNIQ